jgi:hypothetical protein
METQNTMENFHLCGAGADMRGCCPEKFWRELDYSRHDWSGVRRSCLKVVWEVERIISVRLCSFNPLKPGIDLD